MRVRVRARGRTHVGCRKCPRHAAILQVPPALHGPRLTARARVLSGRATRLGHVFLASRAHVRAWLCRNLEATLAVLDAPSAKWLAMDRRISYGHWASSVTAALAQGGGFLRKVVPVTARQEPDGTVTWLSLDVAAHAEDHGDYAMLEITLLPSKERRRTRVNLTPDGEVKAARLISWAINTGKHEDEPSSPGATAG